MASPEALQHRAQSLTLSLQRRTSHVLREVVWSRAVQISREHLADDFLGQRLTKANYNSLVRLAAEEVLTWPAAIGGPLRQGVSSTTDELFRQRVVAFLDAKKLLLDHPAAEEARAHAPAACYAANCSRLEPYGQARCPNYWLRTPKIVARDRLIDCSPPFRCYIASLFQRRIGRPFPPRTMPPMSQVSVGFGATAGENSLLLRLRLPWASLIDGAARSSRAAEGDDAPSEQIVKLFAAAAGQILRGNALFRGMGVPQGCPPPPPSARAGKRAVGVPPIIMPAGRATPPPSPCSASPSQVSPRASHHEVLAQLATLLSPGGGVTSPGTDTGPPVRPPKEMLPPVEAGVLPPRRDAAAVDPFSLSSSTSSLPVSWSSTSSLPWSPASAETITPPAPAGSAVLEQALSSALGPAQGRASPGPRPIAKLSLA